MGNLDRIELLRQFISEEPENPFNLYALALELQETEPKESDELFNQLLHEFPEYLPTYYPAAHFFAEWDELEKAKETFENGIDLAKTKLETKTLQELNNAYQNFLFENDLD